MRERVRAGGRPKRNRERTKESLRVGVVTVVRELLLETHLGVADVVRPMSESPLERPELGVENFDVVFAEELDGVFFGETDGAIFERREDRRGHVHVIRQRRTVREQAIRQ